MNKYVELKKAFQFLDCATRQREVATRCRDLPSFLRERPLEPALRDYLFCLMLVATVTQLEADIEVLSGIPYLKASEKLAPLLRVLREHFSIPKEVYEAVDRIREARNSFIHQGRLRVDPGCTKADVPGIVVTFLQRCRHPDHT